MGFEQGNSKDGKHYWLTPPELMQSLQLEFEFDFDPCPYPKPEDFDGLDAEWGKSNYVNPPFGVVMHKGKKKGATAWARKSIEEFKKGKRVVMVYPIDKWVLMLLDAGAKVRNLKDVRWCATEDGSTGKGTGRHIAMFVLDHEEFWPKVNEIQFGIIADKLIEWKRGCGVGGWHKVTTRDNFLEFLKYEVANQVMNIRKKLNKEQSVQGSDTTKFNQGTEAK